MVPPHKCNLETVRKTKTCSECNGDKYYEFEDSAQDPDEYGRFPYARVSCPECGGLGSIYVYITRCTICGNTY